MKLRTSELTGPALDWAVAKCLPEKDFTKSEYAQFPCLYEHDGGYNLVWFNPTENWAQGGPIIEREHIGVCYYHEADGWEVPNWAAWRTDIDDRVQIMGETALIAAMRCFCSAKLGDEIDIPEELCQQRSS